MKLAFKTSEEVLFNRQTGVTHMAKSIIEIGSIIQLNAFERGDQNYSNIESLSNGNLVASWVSFDEAGENRKIFARIFDSDGIAVSEEFQVSPDAQIGNYSLQRLSDDSFMAVWTTNRNYLDESSTWYARRFDNLGNGLGEEFIVVPEEIYLGTGFHNPIFKTFQSGDSAFAFGSGGRELAFNLMNELGQAVGERIIVSETALISASNDQAKRFHITDYNEQGQFAVVWKEIERIPFGEFRVDLFVQVYNSDGSIAGGKITINDDFIELDSWSDFSATWLVNGDLSVAWVAGREGGGRLTSQVFGISTGGEYDRVMVSDVGIVSGGGYRL